MDIILFIIVAAALAIGAHNVFKRRASTTSTKRWNSNNDTESTGRTGGSGKDRIIPIDDTNQN